VIRRLNKWRNNKWSATLESLVPEDQSLSRVTKRVTRVHTPSPWTPQEESLCQSLRKLNPLQRIWRVSFSRLPTLRSRQLLRRLRCTEVLLFKSCQRTPVNHPWRGSRSHQGSQGQNGSRTKRNTEQGIHASSQTSCFPPRP
jgi:hypothetical protein